MPWRLVLVDFDDTLVDTGPRFSEARDSFFALMEEEGLDPERARRIHHEEVEVELLATMGLGPHRLGPSFEETYRRLCARDGRRPAGRVMARSRELATAILGTPPPLNGALDALRRLAQRHPVTVYTQASDRRYQMARVRESGVAAVVEGRVRVTPRKSAEELRRVLDEAGVEDPRRAVMVGNSVKSDVNPALEAGVAAIHVERDRVWHHDRAEPLHDAFVRVPSFTRAVDHLLGG